MSNKSFDNASSKRRQKIALEKASSNRRRKIALFAVGMAIVVGVVAYSLATRNSNPATASASNNTSSTTTNINELNWVKNLPARFAEHDFVFVILSGRDSATQRVSLSVASAVTKMQAQGIRTDTLTLKPNDPELSVTATSLNTTLPAVLALGASGNGLILTNNITETMLLQAYLTASQACAPGTSSGCCPTR